jgi:trehalose-phosphatase
VSAAATPVSAVGTAHAPVLDLATLDAGTRGSPLLALLDIDGTLAPIAPRPEDAKVPTVTRDALTRLARSPDVHVVLVTGRAPADGARLVGVPGLWVIGNHGAESIDPDGVCEVTPEVVGWAEPLARAAGALRAVAAQVPGARLEDKRWSLSFHHRLVAADAIPALERAVEQVARAEGLRFGRGKAVFELKAPVTVDKGTAALALVRRLGADGPGASLLALGDDVTDEDTFRRVGDAFPHALTVRVGAPEEPTAARYTVPDVAAAGSLVAHLAARRAPTTGR